MKIAIVCGHFMPDLGYVEVHLANAFHRLGHQLRVITSNKASFSSKFVNDPVENHDLGYEVSHLKASFSYGQIVICNGIEEALLEFKADKVIVIGLGKLFPKAVFRIKKRNFELITLLGDNESTYAKSNNRVKSLILQHFFKVPVYKLAVKESDKIFGYTPSTKNIVANMLGSELKKELQNKYSETSLGFNHLEFFYSEQNTKEIRASLGINQDEIVLITATRITRTKNIENVIESIQKLHLKGVSFKYVLIGFSDSNYCNELKKLIKQKELSEIIITLPFMPRKEMNTYYNLANIGLWTQAAISIFEALACGLYLLLPNSKNVSHILNSKAGDYFKKDNLTETLEKAILNYNSKNRMENAKNAKDRFAFEIIAQNIISS